MKGLPYLRAVWSLLRGTILSFLADNALSRGAAIAFYTATSLVPVLLIVIAIAGFAFGHSAAEHEIAAEVNRLMGHQAAEILETAIDNTPVKHLASWPRLLELGTLIVTASGVFGEMQSALNTIWKVETTGMSVSRLIRARAASLGLVGVLGFLLMVSLVVSAALTVFATFLNARMPFGAAIMTVLNGAVSLVLISVLFAAIYKVLPDRRLEWRDVAVGAIATSILFNIGKSLIGWYIGSSSVASAYGAAGGLIVLLFWVYYSAQIFLLGAEFTKEFAGRFGSRQNR